MAWSHCIWDDLLLSDFVSVIAHPLKHAEATPTGPSLIMPIATPKNYQYAYVPETQEDLDWADRAFLSLRPGPLLLRFRYQSCVLGCQLMRSVPIIDLAKYETEDGKKELATELLAAVNTKGFFYLTNFGITQEAVNRQFGIGAEFYATPVEERLQSRSDLDNGNSNGYRPKGLRSVGAGLTGALS